MDYQEFKKQIEENDILLVGLGPEFDVRDTKKEPLATDAYHILESLIKSKDYFVITTNVDGFIYEFNIDPERIVAPCGDLRRMQCVDFSHGIWTGAGICPVCGKPGMENTIRTKPYNEAGYAKQWEVYTNWLKRTINRNIFLLELGEGFETPTVMRWPFEKIAFMNDKANFWRVNERFPQVPEELKDKAVSVSQNALEFLLKYPSC